MDARVKIGALDLVAVGIGATIGAGLFVVTGVIAAVYAGPAVILSFVLAAFGCGLTGLCYAELSAATVSEGGAYSFARASWGCLAGWLTGWTLVLQYGVGVATVAVGWSATATDLLSTWGFPLPAFLTSHTGSSLRTGGTALLNVPAMFVLLILSVIASSGIRVSSRVNGALVVLKVAILFLFVVFGFSHVQPRNWVPFIPPNAGSVGKFGWTGMLRGAAICYFAYIGFDAVPALANAARKPQRDLPIGILGSLLTCTIIYIVTSSVLTGIVSFKDLNTPDAFGVAMSVSGHQAYGPFIRVGILIALTSVILVLLLALPRILRSMAANGMATPAFGGTSDLVSVPVRSTLVFGFLATLAAGIFPIEVLSESVSFATLVTFLVVCLSLIALRKTMPNMHRPFRVPWVPVVPIFGCLLCAGELVALSPTTWMYFAAWTLIGLVVYFLP